MVPHGPWLGIFGMEDLILLGGPILLAASVILARLVSRRRSRRTHYTWLT